MGRAKKNRNGKAEVTRTAFPNIHVQHQVLFGQELNQGLSAG